MTAGAMFTLEWVAALFADHLSLTEPLSTPPPSRPSSPPRALGEMRRGAT